MKTPVMKRSMLQRARRLTLGALALSLLLGGCSGDDDARPEGRAVRVAEVRSGPAQAPIVVSGVLAARDEARLGFKTGGIVSRIEVRAGDRIKQGQILAAIEANEIDAGLAQAQAAADKAERDLQRARQLFEDDVLTREQLDDLGTAAQVARAQLGAARYNGVQSQLVASADGVVLRRLVEARELVAPGQPVLIVSRENAGRVLRVGLPDRDQVRLARGDRAEIRFDAYPGRVFGAEVIEIGAAADPRTGTFTVELALDASDAALPSGSIGRATIVARGDGSTRSVLPLSALVEGSSAQARIFVIEQDQAREKLVSIAFISGDSAVLVAPLPPGTRVVTDGAAYLADGERVRVVP